LGLKNRVDIKAGERKGVAVARLSDLHRTAVPTVSGFVRVLESQKVVTTLIAKCENWVETSTLKPAFLKGFKRRRGYKKRKIRVLIFVGLLSKNQWIFKNLCGIVLC
jgi:hypothetical protein